MKERVVQTDDKEIIKDRKRQSNIKQKQYELDLYAIMNTPEGRNVIWTILSVRGPWTTSFNPDPYITAFNEGSRNVILMLIADLMRICPELYLLTQSEANKLEREKSDE